MRLPLLIHEGMLPVEINVIITVCDEVSKCVIRVSVVGRFGRMWLQ